MHLSIIIFLLNSDYTHIYSMFIKYIFNLELSWICPYLMDTILEDKKFEGKVTN